MYEFGPVSINVCTYPIHVGDVYLNHLQPFLLYQTLGIKLAAWWSYSNTRYLLLDFANELYFSCLWHTYYFRYMSCQTCYLNGFLINNLITIWLVNRLTRNLLIIYMLFRVRLTDHAKNCQSCIKVILQNFSYHDIEVDRLI